MNDLSVGLWLRRERERRNITLQQIAGQTKVAVPLLEGLEAGDLSRWPGGIYRRAFVRSYALALGLDADEVLRRVEAEHPSETNGPLPAPAVATPQAPAQQAKGRHESSAVPGRAAASSRARVLGTAADLTVALVLGMGSAAAGSRLLWPVLFIAIYYAAGVLMTGTSPMVALLSEEPGPRPETRPDPAQASTSPAPPEPEDSRASQRPIPDRRPTSRRVSRAQRSKTRHHVQ